jgi:tetratricopeptide (TPR) repeat protein
MGYYIMRHNEGEIEASYKRLTALVTKTPDVAKQIGDMLYDAGYFDRAIDEYRVVLAAEPNRKDVVEKIANYYIKEGDTALSAKHLQQAQEAYAKAAKADPLHPEAEGKRLKVEGMIAERDARLETVRRQIEDAGKFQQQAEQLAMQRKPAEAITTLKQAQQAYEAVNDEFPVEYQAASQGLTNITGRLRELKTDLIQNAQSLSGSGVAFDARKLAADARALDEQALQALLTNQLNTQLDKAKAQYQATLEIK